MNHHSAMTDGCLFEPFTNKTAFRLKMTKLLKQRFNILKETTFFTCALFFANAVIFSSEL